MMPEGKKKKESPSKSPASGQNAGSDLSPPSTFPGSPATNGSSKSPSKKSTKGKMVLARVHLLDGTEADFSIERKAKGGELFEKVCEFINLAEKDYFALNFKDKEGFTVWIENDKRLAKQLKNDPWEVFFQVKFYPPEPSQLHEDITRYNLCLQVRNDILLEKLPCSFVTHARLGSYLVQSEMGDYDAQENKGNYLEDFRFAPQQTQQLEATVIDTHKTLKGQSPAEAELNYLETAKKLSMYGVDLHSATDVDNYDIQLGVCSQGLLVFRDKLRMNRFAWPKILKISYKRQHFYIKVRPGEFEQYEPTVVFKLANRRAAKLLWKTCVEHHTFFRLMAPEPPVKSSFFPHFGSKFRYSGRTFYETKNATIDRAAPKFNRSLSGRNITSRSMDGLGGRYSSLEDLETATRGSAPSPVRSKSPKTPKDENIPPIINEEVKITEKKKDKKPTGGVQVLPPLIFTKEKKGKKERKESENSPTKDKNDVKNDAENEKNTQNEKDKGLEKGKKAKDKNDKIVEEVVTTEEIFYPKEGAHVNGDGAENGDGDGKKSKDKSGSGGFFTRSFFRSSKDRPKNSKNQNVSSSHEKNSSNYETTKEYEYEERAIDDNSGKKDKKKIGAFSYENSELNSPSYETNKENGEELSPSGRVKQKGIAFSYAPGEKIIEKNVEKNFEKNGERNISPSPQKYEFGLPDTGEISEKSVKKIKGGVNYVETHIGGEIEKITDFEGDKKPFEPKFSPEYLLTVTKERFNSPEENNEVIEETFGNSPLYKTITTTTTRVYSTNVDDPGTRPASIFSQPGYTTSFLNKVENEPEQIGFENKHFIENEAQKSDLGTQEKNPRTPPGRPATEGIYKKIQNYARSRFGGHVDEDESGKISPDNESGKNSRAEGRKSGSFSPTGVQGAKIGRYLVDGVEGGISGKYSAESGQTSPSETEGGKKGKSGKFLPSWVESGKSGKYSVKEAESGKSGQISPSDAEGDKVGKSGKISPSMVESDRFSPSWSEGGKKGKSGQISPNVLESGKMSPSGYGSAKSGQNDGNESNDGNYSFGTPSREYSVTESMITHPGTGNKQFENDSSGSNSSSGSGSSDESENEFEYESGSGVRVVKTTTKKRMGKGGGRVEVETTTTTSAQPDDGDGTPHIKATKVTTRMATSVEDKEKNATTSQIEEKTFTHTTSTTANRTEQTVVTQEMRATATVLTTASGSEEIWKSHGGGDESFDSGTLVDILNSSKNGHSQLNTFNLMKEGFSSSSGGGGDYGGSNESPFEFIKTEKVSFEPSKFEFETPPPPSTSSHVPLVHTETRKVIIGGGGDESSTVVESGEIISSSTISSKVRTVETLTYKTEKDGVVETRVEQKITIQSDGDPIDHDKALAEAIQEAAAMNPELTVEKIEIQQQQAS